MLNLCDEPRWNFKAMKTFAIRLVDDWLVSLSRLAIMFYFIFLSSNFVQTNEHSGMSFDMTR